MYYCACDFMSFDFASATGIRGGSLCVEFKEKEERDFFFEQRNLFEHAICFDSFDKIDLKQFKQILSFSDKKSLQERKNYFYNAKKNGWFDRAIERAKHKRKYFELKKTI